MGYLDEIEKIIGEADFPVMSEEEKARVIDLGYLDDITPIDDDALAVYHETRLADDGEMHEIDLEHKDIVNPVVSQIMEQYLADQKKTITRKPVNAKKKKARSKMAKASRKKNRK